MRIEFLSNHGPVGGGEVMLLELASAARTIGVTAVVVGPEDSEVQRRASTLDLPFTGVRGGSKIDLARAYRARRSSADLLWCNGPVPAVASSMSTTPTVVHLHQKPSRWQRAALAVARHRARATVVSSHFMAREVPGAVVLANWSSRPGSIAEARRPFPPPTGRLRIGFIGRTSSSKGLDVLAQAVRKLVRDHDVELVIAGDDRFVPGHEREPVDRALDAIADRVTRLGWVDVDDFHRRVDLVVVPSVWDEPFGLVAAETLSHRTPLIVTDTGALGEIVGEDHPWRVPRRDPDAIATTIGRMLAAPDEVSRSVDEGFRRWSAHYSPDQGALRLRSFLDQIE